MKIGMCTSIENILAVKQMGFDYLEPALISISSINQSDFKKTAAIVRDSNIYCEVFNVMFPGDIRLTGLDMDLQKIQKYLDQAFCRAASLGCQIAVLGSGGARRIPDGFDFAEAVEQLYFVARTIGDIAKKSNLTVVIEALNKNETNIINSISEAYEFVKKVNHSNIKLIVDYYHMKKENEDFSIISKAMPYLYHVHFSGDSREAPSDENIKSYREFFGLLKSSGYGGRVSIEAAIEDLRVQGPTALKVIKHFV